MIENKQVNLWRGSVAPPTLYHIWLKDEKLLLRYDEDVKQWVVFLDSTEIARVISEFMNNLDSILNGSVNGYPVKDNPILEASDLLVKYAGNYIKENHSLKEVSKIFDLLMTTKVYGQ